MQSHKIAIKLFTIAPLADMEQFVPVFHRWIQSHALADHLLIDVANYSHVSDGPGTLLVTSEANIHLDQTGGISGLLYVRKQPIIGSNSFEQTLLAVLRQTLVAAELLQRETDLATPVTFNANRLAIRINDRLNAPNTQQTWDELKPVISAIVHRIYGQTLASIDPVTLTGQTPMEALVIAHGHHTIATLLSRL